MKKSDWIEAITKRMKDYKDEPCFQPNTAEAVVLNELLAVVSYLPDLWGEAEQEKPEICPQVPEWEREFCKGMLELGWNPDSTLGQSFKDFIRKQMKLFVEELCKYVSENRSWRGPPEMKYEMALVDAKKLLKKWGIE